MTQISPLVLCLRFFRAWTFKTISFLGCAGLSCGGQWSHTVVLPAWGRDPEAELLQSSEQPEEDAVLLSQTRQHLPTASTHLPWCSCSVFNAIQTQFRKGPPPVHTCFLPQSSQNVPPGQTQPTDMLHLANLVHLFSTLKNCWKNLDFQFLFDGLEVGDMTKTKWWTL